MMPQPLQRLAQSRSKKDFFRHLGWDDGNEGHKRLYSLMKVCPRFSIRCRLVW